MFFFVCTIQATEAQNKIEKLEGMLKAKEEEAENVRSKVSKIMKIGDTQEENENLKVNSFFPFRYKFLKKSRRN